MTDAAKFEKGTTTVKAFAAMILEQIPAEIMRKTSYPVGIMG